PAMDANWFYSLRKTAAEQVDQLRYRKIKKRVLTTCFEIGGALSPKINLDLRTAEWPQMIGRRGRSIGGAKQPAVFLEFLGMLKGKKKFVGQTKRQIPRGRHLVGKRGREESIGLRKYRRRESDDDLFGLDCAIRRFDPEALSAVSILCTGQLSFMGNESPQAAMVAP